MKNKAINYPLTDTVLDKKDVNSGVKTLKSGWITMGKETENFEK